MTNKETAIEVRNIAAVCTPSSAERHRLQDLADRLECGPEPLAVVEGWVSGEFKAGGTHDKEYLWIWRSLPEGIDPKSLIPVTVTVTERKPDGDPHD